MADHDNIDAGLPLVELHRHLEGSLRLETVLELGEKHGVQLPGDTLETLRPHVQAMVHQPGLMAFIPKIDLSVSVLADLDACRRVAHECVEDAAAEGIDYIEVRFSPRYMASPGGLDAADVVAAVADGVATASRDTGIGAKLIGILSRTYGIEACWEELEALAAHRESITALDVAGDEAAWPAALFVEHFRKGHELGWQITAHAGEAAGPENIRVAVEQLGATRIGHGLHAIEDPAVMDLLAERSISLEVCPTSNVQISAVPDYADHPVATYLAQGIRVTLNTDDPAVSGIDLPHEYRVAAPAVGLAREQIRQVQHDGLAAAFLSEGERQALREQRASR